MESFDGIRTYIISQYINIQYLLATLHAWIVEWGKQHKLTHAHESSDFPNLAKLKFSTEF